MTALAEKVAELESAAAQVEVVKQHGEALGQMIDTLTQMRDELGTLGEKTVKKKRGRPAGSTAAKTAAKTASKADKPIGVPTGSVFTAAARGRKQCPGCEKYVAARGQDCPNCGWNFAQNAHFEYTDEDGQEIVMPYFKRKTKKAAKAAKPATAATVSDKETYPDDAILKSAHKHLGSATVKKNGGLKLADLVGKVCEELKVPSDQCQSLLRRLQGIMKKEAEKFEFVEKKWLVKVA